MRIYTASPAVEFHRSFPGIELRLHSERIPPERCRIYRRQIRSGAHAARLFSAFRSGGGRPFVGFGHPLARPMRIGEVIDHLEEIDPSERRRFAADKFLETGMPEQVEVPAYALGEDEYLLLDGNHRTTALCLAEQPSRLTLRVLEAPVDRRFLIDLKYWDGGWRRFGRRLRRWQEAPVSVRGEPSSS